ncbi:N/A [soil metagenome]
MNKLKILIADDERPAREYLKTLLNEIEGVELIAEADNGPDAYEMIKKHKPDLALLDLQMPELSGLEVVKMLRQNQMPLVAFVTAFDQYAVSAFELNAVDYLLKPVEKARLHETINRSVERLEQTDWRETEARRLRSASQTLDETTGPEFIERIPVKKREEIYLIPVGEVSTIIADGELLIITTEDKRKFTINFRLKDLEARLDPSNFVRLSRGAIVNLKMIDRVSPMPGGTYVIMMTNGEEIGSSRLQSKVFRSDILRI